MEPVYFRSPWSRSLKITVIIILALLTIAMVFGGPVGLVFGGVTLFSGTLLMVNGYSVQEGKVVVHGLLWRRIFDLCELEEINLAPPGEDNAPVVSGISGLFGVLGTFGNPNPESVLGFITDVQNAVVIDFFNKRVVVTPENPEAFRAAVLAEYRRIHL